MAAFQTSMDGNVKILTISGRLDPHSGKDLKDTMQSLALGPEPEACDLLVAGFRELFLVGRQISRQGGRLAVCSLRGEVKRVFELACFDTAYPTFDTRDEALGFFRGLKAAK